MTCLLKQITKRVLYINKCCCRSLYSDTVEEIGKFSNGRLLKLKVPKRIASGADAEAVASAGDTMVFATAVSKEKLVTEGFLPLGVHFRQNDLAGGFSAIDRPNRQYKMNKEILTGRTIDRSIRPLFPKGLNCELQVICMLQSDGEFDADVIGINAASTCLAVSSIPWNGPIAAVRVAYLNGKIVVFPTRKELTNSDFNSVVVAGINKVVMLEGNGMPVKKEVLKKIISNGVKECQPIIKSIMSLVQQVGVPKREVACTDISEEIMETLRLLTTAKVEDVFTTYTHDKHSRDNEINKIRMDAVEKLKEHFKSHDEQIYNDGFKAIVNEVFRQLVFSGSSRVDGRGVDDIRPISCSVNLYPSYHGSSRFERGQTIVNCSLKMDSPERNPSIDAWTGLPSNYSLEYRFPSFAVGEIGIEGRVTRREKGHGALARKGLLPLIPETPYNLCQYADVVASNGSSSMATVCAGSMALLDAGIEMTSPASGVAIGLITNCDDDGKIKEYKLLTDILGFEDYFGDMDFKVAGTSTGITAFQADIKLCGLSPNIILEAIDKAMIANKGILKIMKNAISGPRIEKDHLPVTKSMKILPGQRVTLLGARGRNLSAIESETKCYVSWQVDGSMMIYAPNQKAMDDVVVRIKEGMEDGFKEPQHGQICSGMVTEILEFGIMVVLLPGMKPTLIGNEHLHTKRVKHASDLGIKVGDNIKIQYFGRDPISGYMRLSRKSLMATGSATIAKKVFPDE